MKNKINVIIILLCTIYCKNSTAQSPYNTTKEAQAAKDYQKKYAPIKDVNNYYKADKSTPVVHAGERNEVNSSSDRNLVLKRAKINGKYGYSFEDGRQALPAIYDDAAVEFKDGLASVTINGKSGFIDRVARVIIPLVYSIAYNFDNGLACVVSGGLWGFINKSGLEIIPLKYELTDIFFDYGLAWVKLHGKYGYINTSGDEVIEIKYDAVGGFPEDGLRKVKLNGKWGYVDIRGGVVVPLIYDSIKYFVSGKAEVSVNGEKFYIDKTGKRIL